MTAFSHDRQLGILDTGILQSSKIVQVGTSRGAGFATLLARCGVLSWLFIDPQNVDEANLGQTIFTGDGLGRPKVKVLADIVRQIQPQGRFVTYQCLAEEVVGLEDRVAKANLLKIGVDNPRAQFGLADMAQSVGTDAIVTGMTGDGRQWFVVGVFPDGPPLKELLPKAWAEVESGFKPPAYYPSSPLNAESMNVAAARIAVGLLHYRAGSKIELIAEVGAAFCRAPIAIGFNGYHPESGFYTPATFGAPA